MARPRKNSGFSLIELLFVLAIIGVISAIAIPSFMGQRARARSIGDAQANSQVIRMQLEGLKADTGIYAAAGAYTWTYAGGAAANVPDAAAAAAFPSINIPSSKMNFSLTIANAGLSYILLVTDPMQTGAPAIYKTDQTGTSLALP